MKKILAAAILCLAGNSWAHDEAVANAIDGMLTNPTHRARPGSNLSWGTPTTWAGGVVPGPRSTVLIPPGSNVVLDGDTPPLRWIKVEGKLSLISSSGAPRPITLRVETLAIDEGGEFTAGSPSAPVSAPLTISFPDFGPIDAKWDALMLSRGLIGVGTLRMYGAEVAPYVPTAGVKAGATTVTFEASAKGWRIGDRLVLPGTSLSSVDDDEATIAQVAPDGRSVVLTAPLKFAHQPATGRPMPVANLSRRITLRSESAALPRRAHFMVMAASELAYVGTRDLGRSNKLKTITDPPNLGNVRGRYSWHVHKLGINKGVDPVLTVRGAVVDGDPGWAFVNHSSQVRFLDSIAYRVVGSGFTSEAGDELGTFKGCLAIRMTGTGGAVASPATDRGVADFAFSGHGFWAQGGGVEMEDNIATGTAAGAYVFIGGGFRPPGQASATRFPTANLTHPPDPPSWGLVQFIQPGQVPAVFRRNVAYGANDGLVLWSMGGEGGRRGVPGIGLFEDSYFEASRHGVVLGYSSWQDLKRLTMRGKGDWTQIAVTNTGVNSGFRYEELDIRGGWGIGIIDPTNYDAWIERNTIEALTGVLMLNSYQQTGRTVLINDNVFLPAPPSALTRGCSSLRNYRGSPFQVFQNCKQNDVAFVWNMVFSSLYLTHVSFQYWTQAFGSPNALDVPNDRTYVDGRRLYLREYHPEFSTQSFTSLPLEVRQRPNKTWRTVRDLREEFGLYLGGVVNPKDAFTDPRITGLLSFTDRTILPTISAGPNGAYYQVTKLTSGFMLRVRDAQGVLRQSGPHTLKPGVWNFPRITTNGVERGIPVYCDPKGAIPAFGW